MKFPLRILLVFIHFIDNWKSARVLKEISHNWKLFRIILKCSPQLYVFAFRCFHHFYVFLKFTHIFHSIEEVAQASTEFLSLTKSMHAEETIQERNHEKKRYLFWKEKNENFKNTKKQRKMKEKTTNRHIEYEQLQSLQDVTHCPPSATECFYITKYD